MSDSMVQRVVENLVLLQVFVKSRLVRQVSDCLLKFNEVLELIETRLHPLLLLLDSLLYGEDLAGCL